MGFRRKETVVVISLELLAERKLFNNVDEFFKVGGESIVSRK